MKLLKRTNQLANSTKSLVLDLNTMEGRSYNWYVICKRIGGVLVLNNYNYSISTVKHVHKLRHYFTSQGVHFTTIEAPQGLQDVQSIKNHYQSKIASLEADIAKKGSKKATNASRLVSIVLIKEELGMVEELMGA